MSLSANRSTRSRAKLPPGRNRLLRQIDGGAHRVMLWHVAAHTGKHGGHRPEQWVVWWSRPGPRTAKSDVTAETFSSFALANAAYEAASRAMAIELAAETLDQ